MYRQFTEIVAAQLDETISVPSSPSEVTLAIWRSVADSYDALALRPIWRYTSVALQNRPDMDDPSLLEAVAYAIAVAQHFSRQGVSSELADHFQLEAEDVTWDDVQESLERLAERWRALGM